ncbi:heavy-metal-associated domain-containing protein [Bacillus sp. DX1.1]|uniref:heavy-metal-associated domain-containing protein n=1 Tax=unclassified Bacillus (in: firmicutes) TaxID=185979 RepID=UPI002570A70C|nr:MULTISPECIES: heavy-metal-associated domain-containing protein [unclassified Bacillus (in: firmicutes)]MDM5157255.1 heavy-metal-associated domain-containing protein [Bacillus sp. DX1.1]WJE81483.1 heavy-metal-associated domain-containing protein [Bacillus sp. DX3.1]
MTKAVFQLEPLTCPSCIKKIESTLTKKAGVESVKVLFNLGKVKTQFDQSLTNAKNIEETIKNLGYIVISAKVA